jgi:hypothetical protein
MAKELKEDLPAETKQAWTSIRGSFQQITKHLDQVAKQWDVLTTVTAAASGPRTEVLSGKVGGEEPMLMLSRPSDLTSVTNLTDRRSMVDEADWQFNNDTNWTLEEEAGYEAWVEEHEAIEPLPAAEPEREAEPEPIVVVTPPAEAPTKPKVKPSAKASSAASGSATKAGSATEAAASSQSAPPQPAPQPPAPKASSKASPRDGSFSNRKPLEGMIELAQRMSIVADEGTKATMAAAVEEAGLGPALAFGTAAERPPQLEGMSMRKLCEFRDLGLFDSYEFDRVKAAMFADL